MSKASSSQNETSIEEAAARRRAKILARGADRMKVVLGEYSSIPSFASKVELVESVPSTCAEISSGAHDTNQTSSIFNRIKTGLFICI